MTYVICLIAPALGMASCHASNLEVYDLRCEYLENPLGIDEPRPRFTWLVKSQERGQRQSAYQILVASSAENLDNEQGDLWDSGKVVSGETVNIPYHGRPLTSRQTCYWKVRAWDRENEPSAWSKSTDWTMGLLVGSDWIADYVSYQDESPVHTDRTELFLPAAHQYRKGFECSKQVRRATLYATALGVFELFLNGQRVGDAYFAPGWTDYRKRAYYSTYDVTRLLQQGDNAIGAWTADGWYSGYVGFGLLTGIGTEKVGRYTYGKTPAIMVQLEVEFEDGSRQIVASDESWRVTGQGPIQEADLLMGEYYDARREMPGWSKPGFDDSHWDSAILAKKNGHPQATFYEFENPDDPGAEPKLAGHPVDLGFRRPRLEAYPGNPVKAIQEIHPVDITEREPGTYIFDLGQNFAGVVRLKIKGPQGHKVRLRYGEMLHPDGSLMTENLRKARAQDVYVCQGDPNGELYQPRFTFHGFQYVEVSNFPGKPESDTVTGIVLHSDTKLTSTFECSDPMVNRLFQNVVWTQRANFLDLPTDCPQRDERMGWTGDAQIYVGTATINADVSAFYTKWLRELMESQRPSGTFPGYAPYPFQHGWDFGTAWCDAGIICPWTIWRAYDDTRIVERCWPNMSCFMKWRESTSRNGLGIVHGNSWGDWLSQGEKTPIDYIDTIYFATSTQMMAEMAEAIGRHEEAAHYSEQFDKIRSAFRQKYVKDNGTLTVNTQTAYALALVADLFSDSQRELAGQHLADLIESNGCRMATGFLGTKSLLPVLSDSGQHDLATFLLQSHEFPSWGYEIDQGATSIWERWDSYTTEDGFGRHNAGMNSFAHYSFGAVCEWMFSHLAGIRLSEPGSQEWIISPLPPAPHSNVDHPPIDWVNASYDSVLGRITSNWRVVGKDFQLTVEIPTNTSTIVHLPCKNVDRVTVEGKPVAQVPEVDLIDSGQGSVTLRVASGIYAFNSKDAIKSAERTFSAERATTPQP